MTSMKPPVTLQLVWERELVFGGRAGAASVTLDSAGQAGPSPVQALAFALAGCMGMDVVHILQRGRHELRGLGIELTAERAQKDPHRLVAVDIRFAVTGDVPDTQVQRAIDLSQEKYCSVWHSLRQDISLKTSYTITATSA
jgi:putative redox protein